MKPYLIPPHTRFGVPLPLHPLPAFLNSLPQWPGLIRDTWNGFTKRQAQELLHAWKCKEPLPEHGHTLTINFPTNPGDTVSLAMVRIHKTRVHSADGKELLYAFESFKREPLTNK